MLARQHLVTRTRCVLVAVTGTAGAALLAAWSAATPVTVAEALVAVCTYGLIGAVVWAWLATLSVVAEAWHGRPGRRRVATPLRRVVLLCCGAVLVAPMGAAAGDGHRDPGPAITGLPMPDRATGPAHRASGPRTVVVRAGDCLWHLAAADLPAGASAAQVTARWQAIHRLNAAVIGPDPDLIHPGQRLALPPR
jgi:nucleoid-associated protein YgaU